jgi:hypothetical protein
MNMRTIIFDKKNLVSEVQEVFVSWKKQEKGRNISLLCRESGVKETTLRRLIKNGQNISDESILKVLSYISVSKDYDSFCNFYANKKEIINWFIKNYSYLIMDVRNPGQKIDQIGKEQELVRITQTYFENISALLSKNLIR